MHALPPDVQFSLTADGSPTLCFTRADGYVEKMHHQGGALSESLFIYGEAFDLAHARTPDELRVISMGLGLGYNELITLAKLHVAGRTGAFRIHSFETLNYLRDGVRDWIEGRAGGVSAVVGTVAEQIAAHFGGLPLRALAQDALHSGRLELRGPFPDDIADVRDVNLVYYDAYSNKMDAHLWTEILLVDHLGACLNKNCVLATYAATGALNRALRTLGFERADKAGFLGKRQSTLALR